MKSWGVIAARFHFSLFTSSSSICCKDKRGREGGRRRGGRRRGGNVVSSARTRPDQQHPRGGHSALGRGGVLGWGHTHPNRPPADPRAGGGCRGGPAVPPRGRQGAPAPRPTASGRGSPGYSGGGAEFGGEGGGIRPPPVRPDPRPGPTPGPSRATAPTAAGSGPHPPPAAGQPPLRVQGLPNRRFLCFFIIIIFLRCLNVKLPVIRRV